MWYIVLPVFLIVQITAGKELYKVGIIHDHCSTWIELNISYGYQYLNGNSEIVYECLDIPKSDMSFGKITKAFKEINSTGISALIGPFSETFAIGCENARVPYLVTSMVPYHWPKSSFLIRMLPDITVYSLVIDDMLTYLEWKKLGILYDNSQVSHVLSLLLDKDTSHIKSYNIANNNSQDDVRNILKALRDNYFENYILLCSSENAATVLTQALYLNLLSRPNAWLVVNLDADEVALRQYEDSRANLTSLLIVLERHPQSCALQSSNLSDAVFYDAMAVLNRLIDLNKNSTKVQMRRNLRQIKIDGCTGQIEFTKLGYRRESYFDMKTLSTVLNGTSHLFQSGTWRSAKINQTERLLPSKSYQTMMKMNDDVYGGKTLIVTTKIEPPFVQWKNKTPIANFSGDLNELLEGFCVSILQEIAKLLNFKYNLTKVPDNKFGSLKHDGWTGMIRVLVDKKADIALAPFQITPERSEAADFTKPYMTKGTSVVVKKPERSVSPFQFLLPLSKFVWICIFISFVATALTLFVTSRMNCDRQNRRMDNIRESFWYIWGTLLRGNLQVSPRGISSRIISCVWWFFSLIVVSIYTANLAAFLTISNAHIPIESASDLADQNIYEYGTVDGSQIENFFKHTKIPYYEKMWAEMKLSGVVRRVEDGYERVLTSKYAFLWDSPVVRHATAADCNLVEIGNPFDLKGYGIALQKHSPYTESISQAILRLDDMGILYKLEGKWWRRPNCPDPRSSAKSREIEIQVASGMFIVLLAGIGLAGLVFVGEYIYYKYFSKRRKKSVEEREENNVAIALTNSQNHVASAADLKEEEIRSKLTRTLSIGENSIHCKWESYDQL